MSQNHNKEDNHSVYLNTSFNSIPKAALEGIPEAFEIIIDQNRNVTQRLS